MRISIPDGCENINILLSGGADSSLLTYLVLQQQSVPVICHIMNNDDEIFDKLFVPINQYFHNKFGDRYKVSRIRQQGMFIRDAVERTLSVYPGVVLTGCNKVVTHFTPTVYIPGDTPPVRGPALNEYHLRPFIDIDKVQILQMYIEENILELFNLTRSCGLPGLNKCGGCYFCMERDWAVATLNIIDE